MIKEINTCKFLSKNNEIKVKHVKKVLLMQEVLEFAVNKNIE